MKKNNFKRMMQSATYLLIITLFFGMNSCTKDELGTDATLSALTIDGVTVTGFNAETTTYNVELEAGTTTVPTVAATATDANATVAIENAASLPGATVVTVTAEDETTVQNYTVNFTVAASPYDNADGIMGGKLYSKFYASETGWTAPAGINESDITDYGNFYRCKQCHGWDRMGNEGAYINRGPKTNRPDVAISLISHISADDPQEIFDHIKNTGGRAVDPAKTADGTDPSLGGNEMPDYGTILTDAEIWDIVKFLKEEAYDVTELYTMTTTGTYPTGSKEFTEIGKDGDATQGNTYFSSNCASCHGADGTTLIIEDLSVGQFVREKAYETQHKVKFGNLGTSMTGFPTASVDDVKNLFVALTDTVAYPNAK